MKYLQLGPQADAADYEAAAYVGPRCPAIARGDDRAPGRVARLRSAAGTEGVRRVDHSGAGRRAGITGRAVRFATIFRMRPCRICTYSDVPVSQQALVDFLVHT